MTMQEVSDALLIQRCLAGQHDAWEILLSRYERLIYYTALRAGAESAEAADVYQAVCLIWLKELGRLRDPQRLGNRYHMRLRQLFACIVRQPGDVGGGGIQSIYRSERIHAWG